METAKNHVFVTVAGSSPQIITESLYDFIVNKKYTVCEVHIITTTHGEKECRDKLINYPGGAFFGFCENYGISPADIKVDIRVITDENGRKLDDIRDKKDNEAAANYIESVIEELCARDEVRVLASLSGGRKTMTAYMAYAMQLHARRFDRLYHVLLAPADLEHSREFFYPPANREKVSIQNRGKELTVDVRDIHIENAEIPFIRLRTFIDFDEGLDDTTFVDRVRLTQEILDDAFLPVVTLNAKDQSVNVKVMLANKELLDKTITLKPQEWAFYRYMFDVEELAVKDDQDEQLSNAIKQYYKQIRPETDKEMFFDKGTLSDLRPKINKALRDKIPNKYVYEFLQINKRQSKPYPIYYLHPDLRKASAQTG